MKKLFLMSLLVCVGILQSFADGFYYTDERGVKWGCADDPNSTTVSICDASGYGDEVVIPEKVYNGTKEYTVTGIRIFTFQDNKTLEKVTWPSTVTAIPGSMFYGCSSLKTVENTRNVTSIGASAFRGCNNLIELDLGSCEIRSYAFYDCSKLQSIGELAKCTSVGEEAFYNCSSLENIDLSMCTSIGSSAFSGCSRLQSIGNPKLASIPGYAFFDCSSLEKIDLSMCTTVGNGAFYGCRKLQNVNTSNCTYIGGNAFNGCSSITEVDLSACKTLGNNAFWGSRISKVSLPATLKSMGYQCFSNVKEYTFNGSQPTALYEDNNLPAFSGASYIIRVPESAVDAYKAADIWKNYTDKIFSISDQLDYDVTTTAMDNQSGLEQAIGATNMKKVVSLKATGTINGYDIFMIRTKMTNLHYLDLTDADIVANGFAYYGGCSTEDNVVGDNSFYKLDNLVTLKLPKNAVSIGYNAVAYCSSLESVDFPKNLKYIGPGSFSNCYKLDNVILPDGLESIGSDIYYAAGSFSNCYYLKTIQFPPSLKNIGEQAFSSCLSLEKISLPGLDRIGNSAFSGCSSLKEIRIPSTLQNIGNGAFGNCI